MKTELNETGPWPVVGRLRETQVGKALGTGFRQFRIHRLGLTGLARVENDGQRLDILAVISTRPEQGNFRRFVSEAKTHYNHVRFLDVMSRILFEVLPRYGFVPVELRENGQRVEAFEWTPPNPQPQPQHDHRSISAARK